MEDVLLVASLKKLSSEGLLGGEERKAFQVGGDEMHGELENGKEQVGFRTYNLQKEEGIEW